MEALLIIATSLALDATLRTSVGSQHGRPVPDSAFRSDVSGLQHFSKATATDIERGLQLSES